MNATLELILADAKAQVYYWPLRYLAWALLGLMFSGIGMAVAWLVWSGRRQRADELERENRRLRRELADLEKEWKGRS